MSAVVLICMVSLSVALDLRPTVSKEECYKYQCKTKDIEFEENQCVKFVYDTYYLQPCSRSTSEWYCDPISEPGDSLCYNYNVATTKAIATEPCKYSSECITNSCVSGFCYGANDGESCSDSSYCNAGFYCKSSVCTKQIKAGSDDKCESDYECRNNAGCNGGVCVEYMSLDKGDKLDSCESNFNILCKSSSCKDNKCISAPSSKSKPHTCDSDKDCKSDTSGIVSKCRCGYNEDGDKYCDLLPGDSEYEKYLDYLNDWINSDSIYKCNTLKRLEDDCIFINWDISTYRNYEYYQYRAKDYPLIQDSDDCSMKIYNTQYLNSKYTYDHDDSGLTLAALLLSLIITLL